MAQHKAKSANSTILSRLTAKTRPIRRSAIVQNFVLVWLDSNIDESKSDFNHSLNELRRIVNTIDTFTDANQCIDFLRKIQNEKIFMIISGDLGQSIVPIIHEMIQLDSIYIFCNNKVKHEKWRKEWIKVKGIFNQINFVCENLKRDTQQYDRDTISISLTSKDINRLEPSFMYTQLLKEILVEMNYDESAKNELAQFCRHFYQQSNEQLKMIDEFEYNYQQHTPIWWYTRECFTYHMLNRALRLQEFDIIIKMGFFLRDIHRQIEEIYSQTECHHGHFITYRGQGLSKIDLENIQTKKDGLLAFNNFLSTSRDRKISLQFAKNARLNPELIGVLFQINIDSTCKTAPFASLDQVSFFFDSEKEILFSMHTVFRIGNIQLIEDRLWEIELILTSDDDQQLKQLTERIREETSGTTGWHRMAKLLLQMAQFDLAEEIYEILLKQTSNNNWEELFHLYNQLGWIKYNQGDFQVALEFYRKDLEISEKSLSTNDFDLGTTYSNIATVYKDMRKYFKALEFYQKAIDSYSKSSNPNYPDMASTYNCIGLVYHQMKEYPKALEFYEKTLEIRQKYLPSNHPSLATSYNNIGSLYKSIGEHSKALSFCERAVTIAQNSLSEKHPRLQIYRDNLDDE